MFYPPVKGEEMITMVKPIIKKAEQNDKSEKIEKLQNMAKETWSNFKQKKQNTGLSQAAICNLNNIAKKQKKTIKLVKKEIEPEEDPKPSNRSSKFSDTWD